ncbi:MAG: peptide deformylase [Phycisphaerales bacterium]|nr:peptide deformylase [Phycisphaerales bacterium]
MRAKPGIRKKPPVQLPVVERADPQKLQLAHYPHPALKKIAKPVEQFDEWLVAVVERMKDLMVEHKGVGLAAPQVGLPLRLFVASPEGKRDEAVAFINPAISDEQGSAESEEGCLSLPEIRIQAERFKAVRVEAMDVAGQAFVVDAKDFAARVLQHENDHLDGILLLDRMSPIAKLANRRKIKELEEKAAK